MRFMMIVKADPNYEAGVGQSYEGTLEVRPMFDPGADCS